jgi:hypothetical protein
MSKENEIHCYDYVNHPYERVRDALIKDAPAVFQAATKAAAHRAQSVASELRVDIGAIGIEADIRISVKNIHVKDPEGMSDPVTRIELEMGSRDDAPTFSIDEGRTLHISVNGD